MSREKTGRSAERRSSISNAKSPAVGRSRRASRQGSRLALQRDSKDPAGAFEEFLGNLKAKRTLSCFFCSLPPELRAKVDSALRSKTISRALIIQGVQHAGFPEATLRKAEYHVYHGHLEQSE